MMSDSILDPSSLPRPISTLKMISFAGKGWETSRFASVVAACIERDDLKKEVKRLKKRIKELEQNG